MYDQAILGAAMATTSVLTGFVLWLVDALHAGDARRRRDLSYRLARYNRQAHQFAVLAAECADWGCRRLQAQNNASYREWACRAHHVEAELRRL